MATQTEPSPPPASLRQYKIKPNHKDKLTVIDCWWKPHFRSALSLWNKNVIDWSETSVCLHCRPNAKVTTVAENSAFQWHTWKAGTHAAHISSWQKGCMWLIVYPGSLCHHMKKYLHNDAHTMREGSTQKNIKKRKNCVLSWTLVVTHFMYVLSAWGYYQKSHGKQEIQIMRRTVTTDWWSKLWKLPLRVQDSSTRQRCLWPSYLVHGSMYSVPKAHQSRKFGCYQLLHQV